MNQPAVKPCGTRAAWLRHRKNGETPCEPCREAAARESRERRAKARKVVRCHECNRRTESKFGYCSACIEKHRAELEAQEYALTGGRWVGRNGIQVWVEAA